MSTRDLRRRGGARSDALLVWGEAHAYDREQLHDYSHPWLALCGAELTTVSGAWPAGLGPRCSTCARLASESAPAVAEGS
jgi:hypothetical protein